VENHAQSNPLIYVGRHEETNVLVRCGTKLRNRDQSVHFFLFKYFEVDRSLQIN